MQRLRLNSIVRQVLLEADQYEMPEDPAIRARNMAIGMSLPLLFRLGQTALILVGAAAAGTILEKAMVERSFRRIEFLRADQRNGTLSLRVANKSPLPVYVEEIYGGYAAIGNEGTPGQEVAAKILGEAGSFSIKDFFRGNKPHEDAIVLTVRSEIDPGSDETALVPVKSYSDRFVMPVSKKRVRKELEKVTSVMKDNPYVGNVDAYKSDYQAAQGSGTVDVVSSDMGSSPFVASHAKVRFGNDEMGVGYAIMPVGLVGRTMQHVLVIDEKVSKAVKKAMAQDLLDLDQRTQGGVPAGIDNVEDSDLG